MSVAFDDQGEIVPRRGVTSSSSPAGAAGSVAGMPSRSFSRPVSSAPSGSSDSTKYQCSATSSTPGTISPQGLLQTRQTGRRKRGRAAQGKEFSHDGGAEMGGGHEAANYTRRPLSPSTGAGCIRLHPDESPCRIPALLRGRPRRIVGEQVDRPCLDLVEQLGEIGAEYADANQV